MGLLDKEDLKFIAEVLLDWEDMRRAEADAEIRKLDLPNERAFLHSIESACEADVNASQELFQRITRYLEKEDADFPA